MLDIKFNIENKQSVEKKLTSMGESLDFDLFRWTLSGKKKINTKNRRNKLD